MDLLVIRDSEVAAVDALAADTQATLVDQAIENVATNEDYGSGSIKGLRADFVVNPEADLESPPRMVIMILPTSMTVPQIGSALERKASERFCWGDKVLMISAVRGATTMWQGALHLKTARRFHSGDRLVVVLSNEDVAVAFGAAATAYTFVKAYITED